MLKVPHDPVALEEHFRDDDEDLSPIRLHALFKQVHFGKGMSLTSSAYSGVQVIHFRWAPHTLVGEFPKELNQNERRDWQCFLFLSLLQCLLNLGSIFLQLALFSKLRTAFCVNLYLPSLGSFSFSF